MSSNGAAAILPALWALLQEAAPIVADPAAQSAIMERRLLFLVYAYTIVWVILALYLVSLSVRLRRLSGAVRRLRERLGL